MSNRCKKCGPLPDQICWRCKGTGSADSGGVTPSGESIEVPCECLSSETADEQETIYDRDVRAVVSGWVSDPSLSIKDVASIRSMVQICEMIASEMQKQRKERKASNNG